MVGPVPQGSAPRIAGHIALVLAVALSGCFGAADDPKGDAESDPDASTNSSGGQHPDADADDFLLAPRWAVGHYWTVTDSEDETYTYAVSQDAGSDWIMDTTGDTLAHYDALFDVSTLGPQRKSDLAGSQASDRVNFFDWPLRDAKSWKTTWDGVTQTITATKTSDTTYALEAKLSNGNVAQRYTYDADLGWFETLEFFHHDSGEPQYSIQVTDAGTNWTGTLIRYELESAFNYGGDPVGVRPSSFVVPDEATDVFLNFELDCAEGALDLRIAPRDPDATDQGFTIPPHACPVQMAVSEAIGDAKGEWDIVLGHALTADTYTLGVDVYVRTRIPVVLG